MCSRKYHTILSGASKAAFLVISIFFLFLVTQKTFQDSANTIETNAKDLHSKNSNTIDLTSEIKQIHFFNPVFGDIPEFHDLKVPGSTNGITIFKNLASDCHFNKAQASYHPRLSHCHSTPLRI